MPHRVVLRESSSKCLRVMTERKKARDKNLSAVIACKKGLQYVLLVPVNFVVPEKVDRRVFVGQIDVVNVYQYTCPEPGKHFEEEEVDVTAQFRHVGTVYEQQISLSKRFEMGHANGFRSAGDQLDRYGRLRERLSQPLCREGFDACQRHSLHPIVGIQPQGIQGNLGRETATDFYDAADSS